jgi:hypothetical protein
MGVRLQECVMALERVFPGLAVSPRLSAEGWAHSRAILLREVSLLSQSSRGDAL